MDKRNENNSLLRKLNDYNNQAGMPGFDAIVNASEDAMRGAFSDQLGDLNSSAPAHLWKPIAKELKGKRRRVAAYWYAAAGLAILIAFSVKETFSWNKLEGNGFTRNVSTVFKPKKGIPLEDQSQTDSSGPYIAEGEEQGLTHETQEQKNNTASDGDFKYKQKMNNASKDAKQELLTIEKVEDTFSKSSNVFIGLEVEKFGSLPVVAIDVDSTSPGLYRWDVFSEEDLKKEDKESSLLLANLGGGGLSNSHTSSYTMNEGFTFSPTTSGGGITYDQASLQSFDSIAQKPPVSFGVDFRIPLGKKFYLNQGLQLTIQRNEYFVMNEQVNTEKNYYVGIPLEVLYKFKSWRKMQLLGHAGHLQELLVYQSFSESGKNGSPNFIQLGASLGGSINYHFTPHLGLALYGGALKYYRTAVGSYYTDRSFMPAIKFSITYKL